MQARLQKLYRETIVPRLAKDLGCKSVMEVPRLSKIVLSIGLGEGMENKKVFEFAERDLAAITGQKPKLTKARKSVAGFKVRQGWPIGYKVTLRRHRMYEFLDRLVHVSIPLIRDFRGLGPKGFDKGSNYTMGIVEQLVFREIDYDKIDKVRGLNVTFVTTCQDKRSGYLLLKSLGLPLIAPPGIDEIEASQGERVPATGPAPAKAKAKPVAKAKAKAKTGSKAKPEAKADAPAETAGAKADPAAEAAGADKPEAKPEKTEAKPSQPGESAEAAKAEAKPEAKTDSTGETAKAEAKPDAASVKADPASAETAGADKPEATPEKAEAKPSQPSQPGESAEAAKAEAKPEATPEAKADAQAETDSK